MKKQWIILTLVAVLILAGVGSASAAKPNPPVIPNHGPRYGELGAQWWQWAYSFPFEEVPFLNTGGEVDISAGQSGHIWFLAGANNGLPEGPRKGTVPSGTMLFFPLANFVNDYPCPDPTFEPLPGETVEHFLQRTGEQYVDYFVPDPSKELFATIDGVAVPDLITYRATSSMFTFSADIALQAIDACITGAPQPGVALGYWLLLPPLTPGKHTLHFGEKGSPNMPDQDITYELTVVPGGEGRTHAELNRN